MLGLDIYNGTYQNGINLAKVKDAGYGFAIAKATEGVNYKDNAFDANARNAHAAGMLFGAYHFLRATPIDQQCHDFLAAIKSGGPYACLAIDVENPSSTNSEISNLGKSEITSRILTFYKAVRSAGYKCPVYVYGSQSWFNTYIDKTACKNAGMLIWMASYTNANPSNNNRSSECDMWQWCSDGRVNGANGDLDLNVCYKGIGDEPEYTCDTSGTVVIASGAAYQAMITSEKEVNVTIGTGDVIVCLHRYDQGNKRFYWFVPIGHSGQEAGVYINGKRQFICHIK